MKWFLIVYGILFAIIFIVISVLAEIQTKEENSLFKYNIYQTDYFKIFVISLFFPFTLVVYLIKYLVNRNNSSQV